MPPVLRDAPIIQENSGFPSNNRQRSYGTRPADGTKGPESDKTHIISRFSEQEVENQNNHKVNSTHGDSSVLYQNYSPKVSFIAIVN